MLKKKRNSYIEQTFVDFFSSHLNLNLLKSMKVSIVDIHKLYIKDGHCDITHWLVKSCCASRW